MEILRVDGNSNYGKKKSSSSCVASVGKSPRGKTCKSPRQEKGKITTDHDQISIEKIGSIKRAGGAREVK
jgi:hypothetical protein